MDWIDVKNKKPNRNQIIIVWLPHAYDCEFAIFRNDKFFIFDTQAYETVTHWMEKPTQPT